MGMMKGSVGEQRRGTAASRVNRTKHPVPAWKKGHVNREQRWMTMGSTPPAKTKTKPDRAEALLLPRLPLLL